MIDLRATVVDVLKLGEHFLKTICIMSVLLSFTTYAVLCQQKSTQDQRPLAPEGASATAEQKLPPMQSPKEPVSCAVAGRYFDNAIARAVRASDTYLVVIIRPGNLESSHRLNEMRLLQVKAYLEYTRFPKYVVATGETVRGQARIELYVAGQLLYTLPLNRNRGLNLLSCVAV